MSIVRTWINRRKRSSRTIGEFMGRGVGELEGCVREEE